MNNLRGVYKFLTIAPRPISCPDCGEETFLHSGVSKINATTLPDPDVAAVHTIINDVVEHGVEARCIYCGKSSSGNPSVLIWTGSSDLTGPMCGSCYISVISRSTGKNSIFPLYVIKVTKRTKKHIQAIVDDVVADLEDAEEPLTEDPEHPKINICELF